MGRRVVVVVRQLAGDGHADGLIGVSYRRCDSGGWSDGCGRMVCRWSDGDRRFDRLVLMVDVWSDDVGQPDG